MNVHVHQSRVADSVRLPSGHTYRPDIDGLRAIAVLPVVLFHAHVHPFDGGYVGVDIFFVISGYLITSILMADLRMGRLSITRFYQRRVRRIFPALFVMASACAALAALVFPPQDFAQFGQSLVAMAAFSSNIYFDATHQSAGYFDLVAQTQLLLHTWSLAVEEQFYVLLPIGLLLLRHRDERTIARVFAGIAVLSFVFSAWAVIHWPSDAFYNVASRAWELLLGGLVALPAKPRLIPRMGREALASTGIVFITIAIFGFSASTTFPGPAAVLPCVGAAFVIAAGASGPTIVGRALSSPVPVAIGLVSYSLYLWHWPVIVLVRYLTAGNFAAGSTITALGLAAAAAVASYRWVEAPFRHGGTRRPQGAVICAGLSASAIAMLVGACIVVNAGLPTRFDRDALALVTENLQRQADHPPPGCDNFGKTLTSPGEFVFCTIGRTEAAKILVWGDSHADGLRPLMQQLYEEKALAGKGVVFAVAAGCPPAQSLNRTNGGQCDLYAKWAMARAEASDIDTVFINFAAWWDQFDGVLCRSHDAQCLERLTSNAAEDVFIDDLRATLTNLTAMGKHVIVGLPAPSYSRSIPQMEINGVVLGGFDRLLRMAGLIRLERYDYLQLRRRVRELADQFDATTFDPRDGLCKGGDCRYARNGVSIYVDYDHIAASELGIFHDSLLAALR